jgi:hypothetical protein
VSIARIAKSDLTMKHMLTKVIDLEGNSLFVLGPNNCFRVICSKLVSWKYFDNITVLAITVSTINLSIDSPLNDPNSKLSQITWYIDIAMNVVFTVEAATKIIVFGFLFNGKQSYLRTAWNIIDFFTVVTSVGSYFAAREDSGYSFIKVLRVVRFQRPLRIIQKNPGLKIAV